MSKKDNKKESKLLAFAESQTDMSPISLADIPYVEINGRNHIEVDGVYRLLECNDSLIKMHFRKNTISFKGENLHIQSFGIKNATIKGIINSIEFN